MMHKRVHKPEYTYMRMVCWLVKWMDGWMEHAEFDVDMLMMMMIMKMMKPFRL